MRVNIRTIRAATDLSRPAFAAVRRAALIARAHGARLLLGSVSLDVVTQAHCDVLLARSCTP